MAEPLSVEDLLHGADAMLHYSEWESRLFDEAKECDAQGFPATAMNIRRQALIAHRALVNEDRNDDTAERV